MKRTNKRERLYLLLVHLKTIEGAVYEDTRRKGKEAALHGFGEMIQEECDAISSLALRLGIKPLKRKA